MTALDTPSPLSVLSQYTFIPDPHIHSGSYEHAHYLLWQAKGNERDEEVKKWVEKHTYFLDLSGTPHHVTILAIAVIKRNRNMTGYLLEHNADPFSLDKYRQTPWSLANVLGDTSILSLFQLTMTRLQLTIPTTVDQQFAHFREKNDSLSLTLSLNQAAFLASSQQASKLWKEKAQHEEMIRKLSSEKTQLAAAVDQFTKDKAQSQATETGLQDQQKELLSMTSHLLQEKFQLQTTVLQLMKDIKVLQEEMAAQQKLLRKELIAIAKSKAELLEQRNQKKRKSPNKTSSPGSPLESPAKKAITDNRPSLVTPRPNDLLAPVMDSSARDVSTSTNPLSTPHSLLNPCPSSYSHEPLQFSLTTAASLSLTSYSTPHSNDPSIQGLLDNPILLSETSSLLQETSTVPLTAPNSSSRSFSSFGASLLDPPSLPMATPNASPSDLTFSSDPIFLYRTSSGTKLPEEDFLL